MIAYLRRAPATPELEPARVVDFANLPPKAQDPIVVGVCALGTTIKQAGSQAAFAAVDRDAVVAFARHCLRSGATTFVMVSSVGADKDAKNFYLRVKGEAEAAVAALGFPRLVILRPSLLLGSRQESRPGEAVARAILPAINPLMAGPLRRYRAIDAAVVSTAMVAAAIDPTAGHFVWHWDEIMAASVTA